MNLPQFNAWLSVHPLRLAARWLALLLATVLTGFAVDTEYDARPWGTDDGLPHNNVNAIVQDHARYLWFATMGGLARFDGRSFKEIPIPAAYRSGGYNIRAIIEERPEVMIIISASSDLLRINGNEVTPHPLNPILKSLRDSPSRLFVDPAGAVWVGTGSGRLYRMDRDGTILPLAGGQPVVARPRHFSFAVDENGETWVAVSGYLAVYRAGELHPYPHTSRGLLITSRRAGGFWICDESHLLRMDRGKIVEEVNEVPWQNSFTQLSTIFEDSDGVPWIGLNRDGLFRYAEGRLVHVPTPSNGVDCFAEDHEGSLWVGTNGDGALRLRIKSHHFIGKSTGLEQTPSSLSEDSSGKVWLAQRQGGISVVDPASNVSRPELPPPNFANVILADLQGRIWFGGGNRGLTVAGPDFSRPAERLSAPTANLHLLFCAKNGDVWFGAEPRQLGYYHDGEAHLLTAEDGYDGKPIRAITQDSAGDIWLGSFRGGLFRWNGKKLQSIQGEPGLPDCPINDLIADGPGNLWIATTEGLVRREDGKFRTFTKVDGLADNLLLQVVEDNFGRLWLGARSGLFVVSKIELQSVSLGQLSRVSSRLYARDHGLVGVTLSADHHPKCLKARDGRLWFATQHGALVISPSLVGRDLLPPPILIDEVRLDGARLSTAAPIKFPVGDHRLEVQFAAPSFLSPENVQVSYRLEGIDRHWLDAGADRAASFVNLPSGNYRLRATAQHRAASITSEPVELAFVVTPAWWETTYARLTALLLLTGFTALIVRAASQRALKTRLAKLESEHALEKERARIARDLHDELGSGLTELGMLADRISDTPSAEIPSLLRGFGWRTRRLAAELSSIVWTMSSANGRLDALGVFIRQYAQRLFRHTGATCIVSGVDALPAIIIAPEPQQQLLATIKEALNNVIKHSHATQAEISLSWENGVFDIVIRDNGIGFDVEAKTAEADGNGLRNMRSRAVENRGTLTLESRPSQGTTLHLRFPLPGHPVPAASNPAPRPPHPQP